MLDLFNIPQPTENIQVFYSNGITSNASIWNKPPNVKFVHILTIGAGGAGGPGGATAGTLRAGGGGGGSGALAQGIYPANILPDMLYVWPGLGGGKGASNNGGTTLVSLTSSTSAVGGNSVLWAGGGFAGNSAGSGGAAGAVFTVSSGFYSYFGHFNTIAGQAGTSIAAGNAGASTTITLPVSGGASGGGSTAANSTTNGGNITGLGLIPTITGGVIGSSVLNGQDGYSMILPTSNVSQRLPLFFTGGAGGASGGASNGNNGGMGAIGCGGGGGGAGAAGGLGGFGGDGIVVISAW